MVTTTGWLHLGEGVERQRVSSFFLDCTETLGICNSPKYNIAGPQFLKQKDGTEPPKQCKIDVSKSTTFPTALSSLKMNLSYPLQFI